MAGTDAVIGIIIRNGKTWLGRRKNPPRAWSPPGGFIGDRSEAVALSEEIQEETGLEPRRAEYLGSFYYKGVQVKVYAIEADGEAQHSGEFFESGWFELDKLPSPLSPGVKWFQRAVEALQKASPVKVTLPELADPRQVRALSDDDLRAKHWRLHQNWANKLGDEELLNAHIQVVRELIRRGFDHRTEGLDSLDEATFRLFPELLEELKKAAEPRKEAAQFFEGAEDFVYLDNYISLTGSFVYPGVKREPNDIDFVIRQSFPDSKLELKLVKMAKTLTPGKRVHFIYDPAGPTFHHLPLYDLVVRKKSEPKLHVVEEPEFARQFYAVPTLKQDEAFEWTRQMGESVWAVKYERGEVLEKQIDKVELFKPHPVYETAGEFYSGDEEALVEWCQQWWDKGQTTFLQPKFDGLRFLIHKDGDKIEFYTSDTLTARAEILRTLADEFKKISAKQAIIDAELVEYPSLPWRGKEPKPRYQMVWMSSASSYDDVADREKNVVAFCHDITLYEGENVSAQGYAARLATLRKAVGNSSDRIVVADTWETKDEKSLKEALEKAKAFPGSEGAMLKASDFPYKIAGANQGVAKYKVVTEIDCLIIGYRPQPKGKPKAEHWTREQALEHLDEQLDNDTYFFRCAIKAPDGRFIPIEANHVTTKQDVNLGWDEENQEWEGLEGPRFWKMGLGWPQAKEGDIAYGSTYARKWEEKDEPVGYVATVAPVEIQLFEKPDGSLGLAWMFPRVRNFKPKGSPVARVDRVLEAFGYDPDLWKKIKPSHEPVEKQGRPEDEEPAIELTHEEQRKLEQELFGDPYMVRQPAPKGDKPATFEHVCMMHVRGIWSPEQLKALQKVLRELEQAEDPKAKLEEINREFEPWYFKGSNFETYLKKIYRVGEEEGDVAGAVESELQKGIPEEYDPARVIGRGNAHMDWRFQSPEGRWLFGWTLATPSVVFQKLDGTLIFPLRNKLLEHEDGDNIVTVRKAAQPPDWLRVVSRDRPVREVEPGEVGATEKTGGAFYFAFSGRYVAGVQKSDAHEYFIWIDQAGPSHTLSDLKKHIEGRWMFRMIQGEFEDLPRSVWIANRPFTENGQVPYVLTHDREKEEAKAEKESVNMFWNGEETIANLRLLGYPLPEEEEKQVNPREAAPFAPEEWGKKAGFIYVELFDFALAKPETVLILPFVGREGVWEVTAEFKEPVPDPWKPGKQLKKTTVGYAFDKKLWTAEKVAELLNSMGLQAGKGPGEWRLVKTEVSSWEVTMRFVKAAKRIVTGVVLTPNEVDAQGDIVSEEDIADAMFRFMRDYGTLGYMHKDYKRNLRCIECWQVRTDYIENGTLIRKGAWMMTVWVGDDEIWRKIEKGELTGFSIKGRAKRTWVEAPGWRAA